MLVHAFLNISQRRWTSSEEMFNTVTITDKSGCQKTITVWIVQWAKIPTCWWLGSQAIEPLGSGGPRTQQEGVKSLGACSSRGFGPLIPPCLPLLLDSWREQLYSNATPLPHVPPCHRPKSKRITQLWTEISETKNQSKSSFFLSLFFSCYSHKNTKLVRTIYYPYWYLLFFSGYY